MTDHPIDILKWLAEAGADEALAEKPIDRFLETERTAKTTSNNKAMGDASHGSGTLKERLATINQNAQAASAKAKTEKREATLPDEAVIEAAQKTSQSANSLEELKTAILNFKGCNLAINAKNTVVYSGNTNSSVMIIGEAPDREEDGLGEPFSGSGGLLLEKMLASIGLDKNDSYLATALPWHPPGNRPPTPVELQLCRPFIIRQIELLKPKLLILLGSSPAKIILQKQGQIHTYRGKWETYQNGDMVIPTIISLHPSFLLKQPAQKNLAWQDLLQIKTKLAELES